MVNNILVLNHKHIPNHKGHLFGKFQSSSVLPISSAVPSGIVNRTVIGARLDSLTNWNVISFRRKPNNNPNQKRETNPLEHLESLTHF